MTRKTPPLISPVTDDIVERLRAFHSKIMNEAAIEIESLRADRALQADKIREMSDERDHAYPLPTHKR